MEEMYSGCSGMAAVEVGGGEWDTLRQTESKRRPKDFEALRMMRELEAAVVGRLVTVRVDVCTIVRALPHTLPEHLKGLGLSQTRIETCYREAEKERKKDLPDLIAQLWQAGHSTAEISGMTGTSRNTVYRVLAKRGLGKRWQKEETE